MHHALVYLVGGNPSIDRVCFWAFVTAIASIVSALAVLGALRVAWVQLSSINKTSRADFLHKFTEGFFDSDCLALLMLFEYNLIQYKKMTIHKVNDYLYFEVDKDWIEKTDFLDHKFIEKLKNKYADYDVDQLLGYFEDIGHYEKKRLLDIGMVYEVFGAYIEMVWEHKEIKNYIKDQKKKYGQDMYDGFRYIYDKVKKYQKEKREKMKTIVKRRLFFKKLKKRFSFLI